MTRVDTSHVFSKMGKSPLSTSTPPLPPNTADHSANLQNFPEDGAEN